MLPILKTKEHGRVFNRLSQYGFKFFRLSALRSSLFSTGVGFNTFFI
jgi:hypothetical protein